MSNVRKEIKRELTRLLRDATQAALQPSHREHEEALALFRGGKAYGTVTIDFLKKVLGKEPINTAYQTLNTANAPRIPRYVTA